MKDSLKIMLPAAWECELITVIASQYAKLNTFTIRDSMIETYNCKLLAIWANMIV